MDSQTIHEFSRLLDNGSMLVTELQSTRTDVAVVAVGETLLDQTRKLRDWLALSPERMKRLGLYPEIILYLSPAKFEQLFRITSLSDQDFEKFCARLSEIRRLPYDKYSEEFNRLLGFFRIPVVMDVGELKEQIKKGKLPSNVARQLR